MMFDFVDGAAGQEQAKRLNREAIEAIRLQPRVLINVEQRSLKKTFLGRKWGLPFGIAPMGMCNLAWPNADKILAEAAVVRNIPLALSTMASSSLEDMGRWANDNAWFQLYVGQSEELAMELVDRAMAAEYPALILTVDVPQVAPRLRDLRNGFGVPFRIGPKQFLDFATHPRWSISTIVAGAPKFGNVTSRPESSMSNSSDQKNKGFNRNAGRGLVDWSFLERLRDRWPSTLIVKGVLSPEDAQRIQKTGADAIYVSNHGGRQLDSAPPAIQMLPLVRDAVGPHYPLLFDGGIRNGESVIKALALGADFVMLGRPFLYGVGAAGKEGIRSVIELLSNEVSVTLAQIGCPNIEDIGCSVLAQAE